GSAVEKGVTRKQDAAIELWCVKDNTARRVAWGVDGGKCYIGDFEGVAVVDVTIWLVLWVCGVPEHLIVSVNQYGCINGVTEFDDFRDMDIVAVGEQNR